MGRSVLGLAGLLHCAFHLELPPFSGPLRPTQMDGGELAKDAKGRCSRRRRWRIKSPLSMRTPPLRWLGHLVGPCIDRAASVETDLDGARAGSGIAGLGGPFIVVELCKQALPRS